MLRFTVLLVFGLLLSGTAGAQAVFPNRPVTMVVGFAPGGGTDTVARILAKTVSEQIEIGRAHV